MGNCINKFENKFLNNESKLENLIRKLDDCKYTPKEGEQDKKDSQDFLSQTKERINYINKSIIKSIDHSKDDIEKAINLFHDWMINGSIVYVLGAGRARLAASIPANRLSHGGARIHIQDDIIPLPHSIKCEGIIAASASGKTESVLNVIEEIKRRQVSRIHIIGIADYKAYRFKESCTFFIGIRKSNEDTPPLIALADTGEYVISELLDAMVVAAGKKAGFDESKWRLGHEDMGSTGPYGLRFLSKPYEFCPILED